MLQKNPWWLFVAVSLITVLGLYWVSLFGPFVLDDSVNLNFRNIERFNILQLLQFIFSNTSGELGRPVSMVTFTFNYMLFGQEALSFKVVNVLLHALLGVCLCRLGFTFIDRLNVEPGKQANLRWLILAATFVWLIHPMQVSTVAYAVQRMAMLSALFTVLSITAFVRWRVSLLTPEHGVSKKHLRTMWRFLSIGLYAVLAVLSKENGVLIPVYFLLIEWLLFGFKMPARKKAYQALMAVYIALPLGLGLLGFIFLADSIFGIYAMRDFTLIERVATQMVLLFEYMFNGLLPNVHSMSLYADNVVVQSFAKPLVWLAMSGHLVLIGAVVVWRKQVPLVTLGVLWFYGSHLLESTIFPLELKFEHRNYLALWGLLLALGFGFLVLLSNVRARMRTVLYAGLALFVLVLCATTAQRAFVWGSQARFAVFNYEKNPDSLRAASGLIAVYGMRQDIAPMFDVIEKAQIRFPNDPAIFAEHWLRSCDIDSPFERASTQKIVGLIRERGTNPYLINILRTIVKSKQHGYCENIEWQSIYEVLQAAAEHAGPQVYHHAHYELGLLLLHAKEYAAAEVAFKDSLGNYRNAPVGNARATAYMAYVQALQCKIAEAKASREAFLKINNSFRVNETFPEVPFDQALLACATIQNSNTSKEPAP